MRTILAAAMAILMGLHASAPATADPPTPGETLRAEISRALGRIHEAVRTAISAGADGDALMSACTRAAVGPDEPTPERARAAMIALALTVDSSKYYHRNPAGGGPFVALLPAGLLEDLAGAPHPPAILTRHDWAQHFAVSAALAAQLSPEFSLRAGYAKEISDARERETGPASGFSFADLEADYAGIELARRLLKGGDAARAIRDRLAAGATIRDFAPDLREMPEELSYTEYLEQYGGPRDERYRTMTEKIRRRISACPGFADPPGRAD